jgi:hypothetical protein
MQFPSPLSPSSGSDGLGTIQVWGVRENNLKNISVDIPRRENHRFHRRLGFGEIVVGVRHDRRGIPAGAQ